MNNWDHYANRFLVRFYPDTPVLCYTYSKFVLPMNHLPQDQQQDWARKGVTEWITGNMEWSRYMRLKEDIREYGIINPFTVEYYDKPPGAPKSLAIRTGNNRACVMEQLGLDRAPVLFVVPQSLRSQLPSDDAHEELPIEPGLLDRVDALWQPVTREPTEDHDGMLGTERAWTDSNLLLAIVQSTVGNPMSVTRVKQRR